MKKYMKPAATVLPLSIDDDIKTDIPNIDLGGTTSTPTQEPGVYDQ